MSRGDFLTSLELPPTALSTPGKLVVVEQIGQGIDAQFATHFLLRDFILQQQEQAQGQGQIEDGCSWRVVLVTTSQSGRHWRDIGTKLGWNFGAVQKQGNLHVIDLIEEEWTRLSISTDCSDIHTDGDDKAQKEENDLLSRVSNALMHADSKNQIPGPNLILIEDLTALFYTGGGGGGQDLTERSIVELVFKLKRLAKTRNATLLTLVHSLPQPDLDPEGGRLAALMSQNYADICLTISPLSTGSSPQITGHLQVKHHPKDGKSSNKTWGGRRSRLTQYKLDERNVRVNFITGT